MAYLKRAGLKGALLQCSSLIVYSIVALFLLYIALWAGACLMGVHKVVLGEKGMWMIRAMSPLAGSGGTLSLVISGFVSFLSLLVVESLILAFPVTFLGLANLRIYEAVCGRGEDDLE